MNRKFSTSCQYFFYTLGMDNTPQLETTTNGNYKCTLCPATFASSTQVKAHSREMHAVYPCAFCDQVYNTVKTIRWHYRCHRNETKGRGSYGCEFCGNFFSSASARKAHLARLHRKGSTKYKCTPCGAVFERREKLFRHVSQTGHVNDDIFDFFGPDMLLKDSSLPSEPSNESECKNSDEKSQEIEKAPEIDIDWTSVMELIVEVENTPGIETPVEAIEATPPEVETFEEEIQTTPPEVETFEEEIQTTPLEVETFEEEIQTTPPEVEAFEDEIQTTPPEVETFEEEIQTTPPEVETFEEEIQTTSPEVETFEEEIQTTSLEVESPEEEILTPEEEIQATPTEVETPKDEIQAIPLEVGAPEEEIQMTPPEVETLEEEIRTTSEVETPKEEIETTPPEIGKTSEIVKTLGIETTKIERTLEIEKTQEIETILEIEKTPEVEKTPSKLVTTSEIEKTPSVIEQTLEIKKALGIEKTLPVTEETPEIEKTLSVTEETPEIEKTLSVTEETPEIEKTLTVTEETPEIEKTLSVIQETSKIDKTLRKTEETLKIEKNSKAPEIENTPGIEKISEIVKSPEIKKTPAIETTLGQVESTGFSESLFSIDLSTPEIIVTQLTEEQARTMANKTQILVGENTSQVESNNSVVPNLDSQSQIEFVSGFVEPVTHVQNVSHANQDAKIMKTIPVYNSTNSVQPISKIFEELKTQFEKLEAFDEPQIVYGKKTPAEVYYPPSSISPAPQVVSRPKMAVKAMKWTADPQPTSVVNKSNGNNEQLPEKVRKLDSNFLSKEDAEKVDRRSHAFTIAKKSTVRKTKKSNGKSADKSCPPISKPIAEIMNVKDEMQRTGQAIHLETCNIKMAEFSITKLGNPILLFKNFYYRHDKSTYWRCKIYELGCRGRVKVLGDVITELKGHNHPAPAIE